MASNDGDAEDLDVVVVLLKSGRGVSLARSLFLGGETNRRVSWRNLASEEVLCWSDFMEEQNGASGKAGTILDKGVGIERD